MLNYFGDASLAGSEFAARDATEAPCRVTSAQNTPGSGVAWSQNKNEGARCYSSQIGILEGVMQISAATIPLCKGSVIKEISNLVQEIGSGEKRQRD